MRRSEDNIKTPLLVLGGTRSGKSAWAESVVGRHPPPYIYIATAQALDDEMKLRIERHRERRKGGLWETVESPIELCAALNSLKKTQRPVLVDCLSLWLNNLLCSTTIEAESAVDEVCAVIEAVDYPLVIVSNDTGGGIVPDNSLARRFQDLCGLTNQKLARICASVFLVTAGLPLRLK